MEIPAKGYRRRKTFEMSISKRIKAKLQPSPNDWLFSDKQLDLAEEVLESQVKIDNTHSIPYTAGYSKDGKTIYIDKEVPSTLLVKSGIVGRVSIPLHKTFAFHEIIEKALEDSEFELDYEIAHQIALRSERALVESYGADWNDYNTKTLELVDKIYKRAKFENVPKDLDLEPYVDEEDWKCLEKMGIDPSEYK